MSLPEPRIQAITFDALFKTLGLVRGVGVGFDLSPIVIGILNLDRFVAGLPAPLSPVLSPADLPVSPGLTDTSELYTITDTVTIPAVAGNAGGYQINLAATPGSAVTQIDLVYYRLVCTVGPINIETGVLRGMGVLGVNRMNQYKQGNPTVQSTNWKTIGVTLTASFFGGAAAPGLMEKEYNLPANTYYTHDFTRPALTALSPFNIGDGFVISGVNAAATGGVLGITLVVRLRGSGANPAIA